LLHYYALRTTDFIERKLEAIIFSAASLIIMSAASIVYNKRLKDMRRAKKAEMCAEA